MKKIIFVFFVSLLIFSNSPVFSGEVKTKFDGVDITLGGQLRPRYELNDKSGINGTEANSFFSQRSRLNVGVESGPIMGFLQFQDVRNWGDEANTLTDFSADGFDVHQVYIDVNIPLNSTPLNLRVGRQEIILDGHRLVGNVNWAQQARSFDGALLMTRLNSTVIDLFAAKERENTGTGPTVTDEDRNIVGLWVKTKINDMAAVSGTLIYQNDDSSAANMNRATMGLRGTFDMLGINGRIEGYYQFGDIAPATDLNSYVNAYMIGVRIGHSYDTKLKPRITLWYDYLSGDSNTNDTRAKAFNTLYATNHKFYGFMDYFMNVPDNTSKKGLQDIAIKTSIKPLQNVSISADFHHFLLAENSALDGKKSLGQELDLTAKWKYHKHLTVTGGYSHFFNAKLQRALASRGNSDADWAYLMMDFIF